MSEQPVMVRVEYPSDGVALVVLDRPESLNALDVAMEDELAAVLSRIADHEAVSVIVVTGEGRGFCSGADLSHAVADLALYSAEEIMRRAGAAVLPLATAPQVTIAAVNGPAAGGGWGLAMACDLRIVGPRASFTATFIKMGLGPDMGLSLTLPLAVGRQRALELLLTGRRVDADEAARIGIALAVETDPLEAALDLARTIAAAPGRTVRSVKSTLAQGELKDHPEFMAGPRRGSSGTLRVLPRNLDPDRRVAAVAIRVFDQVLLVVVRSGSQQY